MTQHSEPLKFKGGPGIFRVFKVEPLSLDMDRNSENSENRWGADNFKVFRVAARPMVRHETLKTLKIVWVGLGPVSGWSKMPL